MSPAHGVVRPLTASRRAAGLALLEVVVALVVVASFGAALFTWAAQTLQTAQRATDALERAGLERNVTELAASLNPVRAPEGRLQLPGQTLQWRADLARPAVDHVRHPQGLSPYAVSLYRVHFRVIDTAQGTVLLETERLVSGWAQVRVRPSAPPGFE